MTEEIRIGVFICHCGINIGGVVDVPAVVDYASTLDHVVHAERNLYTCSSEGLEAIKSAIKKYNLNRVVVASCTPRTHEPLFRATCKEAGLNPYLFEFVNIRDQCSWVHMHEPERATEKAKDLVRMGVAKAALLEPLEELTSEVLPTAVVIGAGISGMTAALSLARSGFSVHLIEKEREPGGLLRKLYKLYPTDELADEFLEQRIKAVNEHERITLHLSSTVKEVEGYVGKFKVIVDEAGVEHAIDAGVIIVATGAREFEPVGLYEYDGEQVITQLQLEEKLKKGDLNWAAIKNVVMIQCVGARGEVLGYCSKICCMNAIKNAKLIKEAHPEVNVFIAHNELQAYGEEYELYYRAARAAGVRFLRFPLEQRPKVRKTDGKRIVDIFHERLNLDISIEADLVVLSVPLIQNPDALHLSKLLKVPLGQDKFFFEAHVKLRPVDFATDGIFLCGTAHGPKDIGESIAQGYAAASRATIPLAKGYVRSEPITSAVNEELCVGCGICESVCPYGAIEVVEVDEGKKRARVTGVKCKGCGTCGSSCVKRAIKMYHFSDDQLIAQERAAVTTGAR
ncbi:MAG: CoB--CoM heterodisulfide reductase iron-sulfur subunit A family protein [Methanophagales archaeon ANME-1-THS]|nr:MAG: CoB--CoM heterodisulfide reductase iron-sulfur subunit A family protein [Methanophagales archaeon ANME-1-THS]